MTSVAARSRLLAVAASLTAATLAACASSSSTGSADPAPATAPATASPVATTNSSVAEMTSTVVDTSSAPTDEFTDARERWATSALADYVLSFDIESHSRFQGRQWITVISGAPQHTDFTIDPGATIDDWFAYIGRSRDAAANFVVGFDEALGFPNSLDIDTDATTIDDELRISNVVVLPGEPIVELSGGIDLSEQLASSSAPYGSGTRIGVGYEYVLYVHCGVEWTRIDGSWWITRPPRSDGSGNPPEGWGNPYDEGLLYLSDENTADYQRLFGDSLRFTRADPTAEPPGCD